MEINMEAPQNLEIELPYKSTIPLLSMYSKEPNSAYSRDACTLMFITVLFTIEKL
jgi:hypothetical protein